MQLIVKLLGQDFSVIRNKGVLLNAIISMCISLCTDYSRAPSPVTTKIRKEVTKVIWPAGTKAMQ